ncbi:hypothetical protein M419DRAFT_8200 [Trichoderma reesei RUT C-30]|uniref:Uncharacterized protein n=1 Tax=Hypocrea jecorina (strain ATCC 56765 / BCRC 32924 / NRRL 11460 / Rut C-30) TaxID=1344414 RepID=A0A024SB49_HYPJR|nr:hypothetical protein M419DRAFT_8200 [Trichoderma reesei RUT C-30]
MPQLSDIEEGSSSSSSTIEADEDQSRQRTRGNDEQEEVARRLNSQRPSPGDRTLLHSIGKAQGLKLRQASHVQQVEHQSVPASTMTVFSPALPPPPPPPLSSSSPSASSSSSSRTITPPHTSLPNHRVSSSGTVQIVSPGAASSVAAVFPSGGWSSPLGRMVSEGTVGSETSSTANVTAYYDYQAQQRQRQNYQQYVLGGGGGRGGRGGGAPVAGGGGMPFWWMDGSTADLPRHGDGDGVGGAGERAGLMLGGGGAAAAVGGEIQRSDARWLVHAVVHGVVLAMQSGVAAGVLTVFAWMGMWMDDDGGFGGASGGILRSMPSLTTTSVLILCFTTLAFHEIHLLSPVVLLYLQAAILALATVAATSMWMKCVQEENGMVKAAVVWKVTSLGEAEGEGEGGGGGEEGEGSGEEVQGYATFFPGR